MLKTQTQLVESTWTEPDVESSSPLVDCQPPLQTKTKVTEAETVQSDQSKLRTKQNAKKVIAKPTTKKQPKAQPDRKLSVATPSSPTALHLRSIPQVHATPVAHTSVKPQQQSATPKIRSSSRVVAAPTSTTAAPTSTTSEMASPSLPPCPRTSQSARTLLGKDLSTPPLEVNTSGGNTNAPEQRQPTAAERSENRAKLLRSGVFAAQMSTAIQLDASFDQAAFRAYLDQLLIDAGSPDDPIERMLVEQLAMAHLRIGDLSVIASGYRNTEPIKILNAATARLIAEFRKMALTLSTYRMNQAHAKPGSKRTKRKPS